MPKTITMRANLYAVDYCFTDERDDPDAVKSGYVGVLVSKPWVSEYENTNIDNQCVFWFESLADLILAHQQCQQGSYVNNELVLLGVSTDPEYHEQVIERIPEAKAIVAQFNQTVTLEVVVKLDGVPGWGNKAQDFIEAIKSRLGTYFVSAKEVVLVNMSEVERRVAESVKSNTTPVYVMFWETKGICGYDWRPNLHSLIALAQERIRLQGDITHLGPLQVSRDTSTHTIDEQVEAFYNQNERGLAQHPDPEQNTVETDDNYWDCNCDSHFIHKKSDRLICPLCGASDDEMPDSRVNEIADPNNHFIDNTDPNIEEFDTKNGVIIAPGKFEGQPLFVPHFWGELMDGFASEDTIEPDGTVVGFVAITDEDRAKYLTLDPDNIYTHVAIWETDQGFVHYNVQTDEGVAKWIERNVNNDTQEGL